MMTYHPFSLCSYFNIQLCSKLIEPLQMFPLRVLLFIIINFWNSIFSGESNVETDFINIQKKFVPWKEMFVDTTETKNRTGTGVILVASLIDKAANLGGLARTSEIFSAKELVIPNLEITKDKEFLGLSMTAEKHINITEVSFSKLQGKIVETFYTVKIIFLLFNGWIHKIIYRKNSTSLIYTYYKLYSMFIIMWIIYYIHCNVEFIDLSIIN